VDWDGRWLTIAGQSWKIGTSQNLIIVGAGKATSGMLSGLLQVLHRANKKPPAIKGWINVPEGTSMIELPDELMGYAARPAGRNEPTEKAIYGTQQILSLVRNASSDDCVVSLISGGGSALLCSPVAGLSLSEKVMLTQALSSCGANIEQLNSVRRCLSNVKGGGLARACSAGTLINCILSDVLGDPLELIASGPTILKPEPDPIQALRLLDQFLPDQFPNVRSIINKSLHQSTIASISHVANLNCKIHSFILANNATAVDAAGIKAVELGYRYWMKSERRCEGDVCDVGRQMACQIEATLSHRDIDCIITGGEPSVTLPDSKSTGKGGRNQQLALSVLDNMSTDGSWPDRELAFLSAGTDGEDGPTDAAGAWIDRNVHHRMLRLGLNPKDYLARCDAYRFFEAIGSLYKTGPTHTNVCDLRVAVIR
jgi:glycerate 2-kinase